MVTSNADDVCSLQLPDDVKQNIEDAGARYIPYVAKLPAITMHTFTHANVNVGGMVLPMMMIQDDQVFEREVHSGLNTVHGVGAWMHGSRGSERIPKIDQLKAKLLMSNGAILLFSYICERKS